MTAPKTVSRFDGYDITSGEAIYLESVACSFCGEPCPDDEPICEKCDGEDARALRDENEAIEAYERAARDPRVRAAMVEDYREGNS